MNAIVISNMREFTQIGTIFGHRLFVEIEGDPTTIDFKDRLKMVNDHIEKMNKAYLKYCVDSFITQIKK